MKSTFGIGAVCAVLTGSVYAAPADPPKAAAPRKTLNDLAPWVEVAHVEDVKPMIRANAKRQLSRYGPITIPALKQMSTEGHSFGHGGGEKSGGIMNASGGTGMMDAWQFLRGGVPLALADFLSKSLDPEGFNAMHQTRSGVCKDCTILANKLDVVFENGSRADVSSGVYLHHVLALNIGDRKMENNLFASKLPFCSGGDSAGVIAGYLNTAMQALLRYQQASIFSFGAVDEFRQYYTNQDGSSDSGFYRAPEDWMLFQAEIVNYKPEDQKVYLQFDTEFVPGKTGKLASTQFTSVTSCNESIAFLGKGQGKLVGKGLKVEGDGTLVAARGHMHDGGDAMVVIVNGKEICESKADYSTMYAPLGTTSKFTTISKMSDCAKTVPVKKGDIITLEAKYDTIAHPLRSSNGEEQEQMGLMAFTFVPNR